MDKKDILQQVFIIEERIKHKEEQLQELRIMAESAKSQQFKDRVQTTKQMDKIADMVITMMEFADDLIVQRAELLKIKRQIVLLIENAGNHKQKRVLELRYLKCLTWEAIAEDMEMNERYLYKLHNNALKSLELIEV